MNRYANGRLNRPWLHQLRSRRGVASALIILLLVLLIFFGVLSLVTAAADLKLAQKRAAWNQAYYTADARATAVLADIDLYCRQLTGNQLEADTLAGLLARQLSARKDIREQTVARDEKGILLEILVMASDDQAQGIQMRLRVKPGTLKPDAGNRLDIESWTQWQAPFQYEGTGNSVWKG